MACVIALLSLHFIAIVLNLSTGTEYTHHSISLMACYNEEVDDALSFPLKIQGIREQIDTHFLQVHQLVETRRNSLIQRLEDISLDFESKCADQRNAIAKLEELKTHTNKSLKENLVQGFVSQHLKHIDEQIQALRSIAATRQPGVSWQWEEGRVSELIEGLGEIKCEEGTRFYNRTDSHSDNNTNNKSSAIKLSGVLKEMNVSGGLAIDRSTNNIYAIEFDCCRLIVFSPEREFMFTFGDESDSQSEAQGIAVYKDRVYVTRWRSHELQMYTLEGKLIHRVGEKGTNEGKFKYPFGITIDEVDEEVYVCDLQNNRVQIFLTNLSFKCIFNAAKLDRPLDVKVREEFVFILDHSSPCMHILNKNGVSIHDIITRGSENQQTVNPWFFDVDTNNHILLTDFGNHCVLVFNKEGKSIYKIGRDGEDPAEFSEPSGIAISNEGNIIVACRKNVGCLQVF